MKKKFKMILFSFLLMLVLVSCASVGNQGDKNDSSGGLENSEAGNTFISDRKIIYRVELSLKAKDLIETSNQIKALLENDEWIESEHLSTNSNYLTLRVKSSRLNGFVASIRGDFETTNYSMSSVDVSLDYLDTSASKEALENELARLQTLYATANINEMININRRISEVESQLLQISRRLTEYDSLVDFSTVVIWIYGPAGSPNPPSYVSKLSRAFASGWEAVKGILSGVSQAIVFIVPLLVIIVPVGGAVTFVYYKKKQKKNKDDSDDLE